MSFLREVVDTYYYTHCKGSWNSERARKIYLFSMPVALVATTFAMVWSCVYMQIKDRVSTPATVLICLAASLALIAVSLLFYYAVLRVGFGADVDARKLASTGERAEAVVLDTRDTGMTVNWYNPKVELLLEVHPGEGEAYQTKVKWVLPRLIAPHVRPGVTIPVMIDPKNRKKVSYMTEADESTTGSPPVTPGQPGLSPDVLKVLEQLGVNPESATVTTSADGSTTVTTVTHNVINSFEPGKLASTGAAEGELEEHIQAANYELLAEGVEAEATLLEVSELGVSAGTDNPGLSLQLLVRPEGREAFQAQATCFVSRKAVRKFRPGGTVIVKFDPSNTTRVAVARSGPEEQEPLVIE